jgi:hypothetical protein
LDYELYYIGYLAYQKSIVIPIEYLILGIRKSTNGYVFTLSRVAIYGNPLKKHILQDSWWNQSLLLLIKMDKEPSGFRTSWSIFHVVQN